MSVFLRALYGPFGERAKGTADHHIDWYFFGIREDNTMGRWALRFTVRTRSFETVVFPMSQAGPPLPELVDAFVPDKPMIHGRTYLDILKERLPRSGLARAVATALESKNQ
jgi:hypothetical protein